jgi:hypothetical protein
MMSETTGNYMLRADPDKMAARKLEYGWAPIIPVFEGKECVKMLPGHVFPGTVFEWEGNPLGPPRWCSPVDELGEAAYRKQAERDAAKRQNRKALTLARRQAELDALRAEVQAMSGVEVTVPESTTAPKVKASPVKQTANVTE